MFAEVKCCKNSRKRKRNRTIVWTDRCSLKNKIFLELGKEKGEHLGKRKSQVGMEISPMDHHMPTVPDKGV